MLWDYLTSLIPSLKAFTDNLPQSFELLLNFDYKGLVISFGFIYYFTVFFILTRVLVYFGLTLISLINTKHTTSYKAKSIRVLLTVFLKFFSKNSFKTKFLKIATVTCL